MSIIIKRADIGQANAVEAQDFSFLVEAFQRPEFAKPVAMWVRTPVSAYRKSYVAAGNQTTAANEASDALFVAMDEQGRVGHAMISRNWNNYGLVEDIAVDAARRDDGIGRLLMDACVEWSRSEGLAGIMLETQNNNIAACRFYERYGFELGGIDRLLYRGLNPGSEEIALLWYLRFDRSATDVANVSP